MVLQVPKSPKVVKATRILPLVFLGLVIATLFSRSKPFAAAYRATQFTVRIEHRDLVIRVGQRSGDLDRVLSRYSQPGAAFVTAYNPGSRLRGRMQNLGENRRLIAWARRQHRQFLKGDGLDIDQHWEPEKSILIFGVTRTTAARVGRLFGQNAVVYVYRNRAAELIYLQ